MDVRRFFSRPPHNFLPPVGVFGILASTEADTEKAVPVAMVEGRMVDLPVVFPDGSIRFHVVAGSRAADRGIVRVPAGGKRMAEVIFEEDFGGDSGGTLARRPRHD